MSDEIKEILDRLERIDHKEYSGGFEFADSGSFDEDCRCFEERKKLANYITNLQEEKYKVIHTSIVQKKQLTNKLNKLTNKYNDLQKENNSLKQMSKDTYDTSQEIIFELQEELKSANDSITWWTNRFNAVQRDYEDYKSRCEKAIEYTENEMPYLEEPDEEIERIDGTVYMTMKEYDTNIILNILKGVGKDE